MLDPASLHYSLVTFYKFPFESSILLVLICFPELKRFLTDRPYDI